MYLKSDTVFHNLETVFLFFIAKRNQNLIVKIQRFINIVKKMFHYLKIYVII